MGRSHEVKSVQRLLKDDGTLREPGWSRKLYQVYDRSEIKAPKFRIKEWDYYLVLNENHAFAFTISDDGYIGLQSASLLDFQNVLEHTETILTPFPMGKLHMPSTSESGNVSYHDKRLKMDFFKENGRRRLVCEFQNFWDGTALSADITLYEPDTDTMVIATPWKEKKTAFYYNQKINCMRAEGKAVFGGREFVFSPETDFGTLDWGRGVWTYQNRWYWGSGNGIVNGRPFGFNIGYGFGDTSAASENVIFYDGRAHKFDDIVFQIPESDGRRQYLKPWIFTSSDGRFEADFVPVLDRAAKIDVKLIKTDQHQVFGRMSGKAVLDDGTALEFKNLMCFAEDVYMKY
ncbi:MAG: DUF2804 domain-containing protein [Oscillospiraceae bacterium]|jgi:hypothetical protein|nr:DUF2804 domain-containing protein [Oscillospiraceae bacterium]